MEIMFVTRTSSLNKSSQSQDQPASRPDIHSGSMVWSAKIKLKFTEIIVSTRPRLESNCKREEFQRRHCSLNSTLTFT